MGEIWWHRFGPDGPGWWSSLAAIYHETGHNFFGLCPKACLLIRTGYDTMWHGYCTILNTYVPAVILARADKLGLTPGVVAAIRDAESADLAKCLETLRDYEAYVASGGQPARFREQYLTGMGIWTRLGQDYGWDMYPRLFHITEAYDEELLKEAGTPERKNALLVLAASLAAGQDLADRFGTTWGIPLDREFYGRAEQRVRR